MELDTGPRHHFGNYDYLSEENVENIFFLISMQILNLFRLDNFECPVGDSSQ